MKRLFFVLAILGASLLCLFVLIVLGARDRVRDMNCGMNLREIGLSMEIYRLEHFLDHWPDSLQPIIGYDGFCTNLSVFLCPMTGNTPGKQSEVDQWTDYRFNLGPPPTNEHAAVAFCAPENHGGGCGYVLFRNGKVDQVTAERFDYIMENGYMATFE
jgi:hypothetical protein